MKKIWLVLLLILPAAAAHGFVQEFTEQDGKSKDVIGQAKNAYKNFHTKNTNQDKFYGGFRDLYRKFNEKVVVPGLISASPLPEIGKVVGPDVQGTSFRVGDTLYFRWSSGQSPKAGEVYATYSPAIVTQNMANPTDFSVGLPPENASEGLPKEHRLAGYFYEGTGRIRILRVGQGLVEGLLESQTGTVQIGDRLMPALPILEALKPSYGTVQISAAIVSGSPPERISTNTKSFIYINRGSRDGIKVGQVFEAVERVELDPSAGGISTESSAGEAIAVMVTDSYTTAMITKQFDVIRIGALMRTKNPSNPTLSGAPFSGMSKDVPGASKPGAIGVGEGAQEEIPEVPSIDDVTNNAPNLPDPMKKRPEPKLSPLSELDALEKSQNYQALTEKEKARLSKLSRQERLGDKGAKADAAEDDSGPALPGLENSFSKGKKPAKKAAKKKKQANDEEELNMLMMQN